MDEYQSLISIVSLTMGVSWASGVNLYAALLVLGIGGATGNIDLPPDLATLENPLVIGAAGLMYSVEFFADKIPGIDSTWDALHTFVRIPAGAMLAAGAIGDVSPALEVAAGIMGGSLAATSHAAKAGTRLAVNTSPEPFSNWGLSFAEDIAVVGGLWAALTHPYVFILLVVIFIFLAIWLLPKIWAGVKFMFRKLGELFGFVEKPSPSRKHNIQNIQDRLATSGPPLSHNTGNSTEGRGEKGDAILKRLEKLKALLDSEAISPTEYEKLKQKLLNG